MTFGRYNVVLILKKVLFISIDSCLMKSLALQTIKAADIATVKKLGKPPHLIMRIMDSVLILFQKRLDPVTADPERPCPKPSWVESLKVSILHR